MAVASRGWSHGQSAASNRVCRPEPDRPEEKKDASAACWSTAMGSRCRSPSVAQIFTTPSCWIGRWLRSWSSVLKLLGGKPTVSLPRCWLRGLSGKQDRPQASLLSSREITRRRAAHQISLPGFQASRWVVERTHSWLRRYRQLLVSFEMTEASYLALLQLAAA